MSLQRPSDRRLAHAVHLHQLATGRTALEQASCLGLLFLVESCTLRLGSEIKSGVTERVADGVAAHVVPLGELVRGGAGLVVLDQELDDRPVEGVLPGERAVVRLPSRVAGGGQKFGQFRRLPRLLAVVSQQPD